MCEALCGDSRVVLWGGGVIVRFGGLRGLEGIVEGVEWCGVVWSGVVGACVC